LLYRTEVKGIQAWILGSGKLKEIAGGSEVVAQLTRVAEERAAHCGGTVESAAAGGATIRFEHHDQLSAFACWWPMAVAARAPGLSVIQAWVTGDDRAELYKLLAEASASQHADLPEAGPFVQRSGRTGLPAVGRGDDGTVDRATRARVNGYVEGRDRVTAQLLGEDSPSSFLVDIDDFPEGYLAVVHADANGIGALFASGRVPPANARRFSVALQEATDAAAKAAVGTLKVARDRVPARPIVLGGDDFTIIVPARGALDFTQKYLQTFEDETQARAEALGIGGEALHACAGVAIIKPGWPFIDAHALAESLCHAAKSTFRARQESGMAFHRVTTALSDDWDGVRQNELMVTAGDHVLTRNPYGLGELDSLRSLATCARFMPRGALRGWVDIAKDDTQRAQERWDRMREVLAVSDKERLAALDAALAPFDVDPTTGWSRSATGPRSTPILDALEIEQVIARSLPQAVGR